MVHLEKRDKENNLISKLVFRLVRKHIAGSTSSAVLNAVRDMNNKGMHTTVTLLNNHVDDQTKARYTANAYIQLIKQLSRLQLNSGVSIRPSQIGATVDQNLLEWNMQEIVNAANASGQRLWIEEESDGIESVMRLYKRFRPECAALGIDLHPNYSDEEGIVFAKMLTSKDALKLSYRVDDSGPLRKSKERLKLYRNYIDVLTSRKVHLTILEHDLGIIEKLVSISKDYKRNLIFEIPLGYNTKLNKLAKGKLNMSIYLPYGKDWIPYFINRLAEGRVRNIAVKLLKGKKGVDSNAEKEDKN